MENTQKFLFGKDEAEWFLATGGDPLGPLKASAIFQKVISGEVTVNHYVWQMGTENWTRISEHELFKRAFPPKPPGNVTEGLKKQSMPPPPPPPTSEEESEPERPWYLHYNHSQYGPFSHAEVTEALKSGEFHSKVNAWRDGLPVWKPIQEVQEFSSFFASHPKIKEGARQTDKREGPRRLIVARIILTDENTLFMGVCRDISVGGMQVLTDKVPGPVGSHLRLNVSPSETIPQVKPFVAEGIIVRVLEDGRGFSFRFEKMSSGAKKAIEEYISDTG